MDVELSSIRAVLNGTVPRWRLLVESLPNTLVKQAPAAGEWSAFDCLRHLRDAERDVFSVRLQVFLTGGNIASVDPGAHGAHRVETPVQLIDDFAALREGCLSVLSGLNDGDFRRTAHHAEYGAVQLGQLLNDWAAHDLVHTMQAERALMQPFVAGCGPWRWAFSEHEFTTSGVA